MATILGYSFPDELYYHPRYMVWIASEERDGAIEIRLGLSALVLATAGELLVFAGRPLGATIDCDRAIGNVETAKTVSSVRTPVAGRIIAVNEVVEANGELINKDPYAAWLVRLAATDWPRDQGRLLRGDAAAQAIEAELQLYRVNADNPHND